MDCKNILAAFLAIALAACAGVGCKKSDPFERELGLQSRRVVLSAETGITPVMVFSNTSWKVKFVEAVPWAGIDRLSGEYSSGIYFSYAANYGRARKVSLAFEAGSARDTVVMVQKGGLTNASLSLSPTSLTFEAAAASGSATFTTNLREDLPDVVCKVSYAEGDEGWISGLVLSEGVLEFQVAANGGSSAREATIIVSHTDAEDKEIKASLIVTQNPA